MVNFPAWKRIPFSVLCTDLDQQDEHGRNAWKHIEATNREEFIQPILFAKEVIGLKGIDLLAKLLDIDPNKRITAR